MNKQKTGIYVPCKTNIGVIKTHPDVQSVCISSQLLAYTPKTQWLKYTHLIPALSLSQPNADGTLGAGVYPLVYKQTRESSKGLILL